jgi:hypothetical protein
VQNEGIDIANGDSNPIESDGTDFGLFQIYKPDGSVNPEPAQRTFVLNNFGSLPLQISAVTVDFVSGCTGAFSLQDSEGGGGGEVGGVIVKPGGGFFGEGRRRLARSHLAGKSLAPGKKLNVVINFLTDKDCLTATVAIVNVTSDDTSNSPYTFTVTATPVGLGTLQHTSGKLFTVNADAGLSSDTRTVTLIGAGNLDVVIATASLDTSMGDEWTVLSGLPATGSTISPDQRVDVSVKFQPPAGSSSLYSSRLVIVSAAGAEFVVPLEGQSVLVPVIAVAANGFGSVICLRKDGTVRIWGNAASYGSVPSDLAGVTAVAVGSSFFLALKDDKSIVGFGADNYGQISNMPTSNDVIAISAGWGWAMAIHEDQTVSLWGNNDGGQLNAPAGLSSVVEIDAGEFHTVVRLADGTVKAWGSNFGGQTDVPVDLTDVIAVSAGTSITLALKNDGTIVQMGSSDPALPGDIGSATAIAAGGYHGVALRPDGTIAAWGKNNYGQTNVPAGLSGVTAIAAGSGFTVALANGRVVQFGDIYTIPASLYAL